MGRLKFWFSKIQDRRQAIFDQFSIFPLFAIISAIFYGRNIEFGHNTSVHASSDMGRLNFWFSKIQDGRQEI